MEDQVPREIVELVTQQKDTLLTMLYSATSALTAGIVFLFFRLMAMTEKVTEALNNNTEALKELQREVRDG